MLAHLQSGKASKYAESGRGRAWEREAGPTTAPLGRGLWEREQGGGGGAEADR